MTRNLEDALRWVEQGTILLRRALTGLKTDEALGGPSNLPGWSRKHLVAHVTANAEGLGNLVHWARTGKETPMYASPEQRLADIDEGSRTPATDLLERFDRSADALSRGFGSLDKAAWQYPVVTAQGRTVPASETPWMRAREVLVHATDLDGGITFDDLPADFLAALGDDIVDKRRATPGIAVHIAPTDAPPTWDLPGPDVAQSVTGPLAQVVAWLAGRPHHGVTTADGETAPDLGSWL